MVALASFVNTTNLEARNELGLTPLQLAGKAGQLGAAALLLDKGADVNARDSDGNTVLHLIMLSQTHWIAGQPSAAWVERMKQDPRREKFLRVFVTPSGYTSAREVARSIAFFLACGADAAATNHAGQTILELAMRENAMLFDEDRAALLSLLRQSGGGLEQKDASGDTALHRAARNPISGDKAAELIAAGADVNATNALGRTPLILSAERIGGWPGSAIAEILKAKPNVNAQDHEGLTALHVLAASESGFKKEATRMLLDAGANPNPRDKHARTPAHLFLAGKWPWDYAGECLAMLVQAGADLSLSDERGQTPLHCLAGLGSQSPLFFIHGVTDCFASPKVELSARDHQGDTPLHIAARTGTSDVFKWLQSRGVSLDATNNAGQTPRLLAAQSTNPLTRDRFDSETDIFQAAREGKIEPLTRLLNGDPALMNRTDESGQTLMRVAVRAHRTNVVAFLETRGVRWDAVSAVTAGRADVLRGLLAKEPKAITDTLLGRDLLHLAAADGNAEITTLLLDAGSDLRASDSWGLSPVGAARLRNQVSVADLLVSRGAAENLFDAVFGGQLQTATALLSTNKSLAHATNGFGYSVLEVAASTRNEEIAKLLLDKGTPAGWADLRYGWTPLHVAAIYDRTGTAELLIHRGAKVAAVDRSGLTPLHWAALRGSSEVAALLLKHKADPIAHAVTLTEGPVGGIRRTQSITIAGDTPLHLAALFGRTNVIPLLLKAGASINATNTSGYTALDLARLPPWSPTLNEIRRGPALAFEQPSIGEEAQIRASRVQPQSKPAAAGLLASAGGKPSPTRPPGFGPPGF